MIDTFFTSEPSQPSRCSEEKNQNDKSLIRLDWISCLLLLLLLLLPLSPPSPFLLCLFIEPISQTTTTRSFLSLANMYDPIQTIQSPLANNTQHQPNAKSSNMSVNIHTFV